MTYKETIDTLRATGNFRSIPADTTTMTEVIDLSSNDYLGLAERTDFQEEFMSDHTNRMSPMTSSASRLLSSRQNDYLNLENLLESLYMRPALLFNSGYHANTGLISSLAAGGTLIVADKLIHASVIDGIMLSKASFTRFPHNDFDRLEKIVAKEANQHERIIIAVESIYSMDGDSTDIEHLIDIKRRYPNVLLYIDEAHAVGALGPNGLGLCLASPRYQEIDVIVGTFGKAYASAGAFCITAPHLRDYIINKARSFIFSTALPPITARWTKFIIGKSLSMGHEREKLRKLSQTLHSILQPHSPTPIAISHIQPLITGSPQSAVTLSHALLEAGFKVLPIRTPTVPPGTDRLRISLSAAIGINDIENLGIVLNNFISCDKN